MLPKNQPYVIGETAFHHEGDLPYLKSLVDHAAEIGLNAVKFHLLLNLDDYMVAHHEVIDVLRPWCLTSEHWKEILDYTTDKGLDVVLLCNEASSLEWVLEGEYAVKAIELHGSGLNDHFLLQLAAQFNGTVILGVGGSTLDEIQYAIDFIQSNGQDDIFLMYGFQSFPTDYKDINLSKMRLLYQLFNLPMGYADHTDPADPNNEVISVLGAAMGFNVLEKHFTHQFGQKRVDSQAAVSVTQMAKINELMKVVHTAYGNNSLKMSPAEIKYGDTGPMKKAIVARVDIGENETIKLEHIAFKRTNESTYVRQMHLNYIIGRKTTRAIKKDERIDFSNIEYSFEASNFKEFHQSEDKD